MALVDLRRPRRDPLARELTDEIADLALLLVSAARTPRREWLSVVAMPDASTEISLRVILENGDRPDDGADAARRPRACDRRRPDRRRRRNARDGAREPRPRRPGRPLCPARASTTRTSTSRPGRSRNARSGSKEQRRWTRRCSAWRQRQPKSGRDAGSAAWAGAPATGHRRRSRRRRRSTASPATHRRP